MNEAEEAFLEAVLKTIECLYGNRVAVIFRAAISERDFLRQKIEEMKRAKEQ